MAVKVVTFDVAHHVICDVALHSSQHSRISAILIGADVLYEERIIIRPVDGMETPGFQIAWPWSKAFADQCKEPEHMIAGAARIDEMLIDFQNGFVIEQSIEHVWCRPY